MQNGPTPDDGNSVKLFKPMLAATCKDVGTVKYPVLASVKLDGVRATVQGGKLLSRTLKPIPNKAIQKLFAGLPEGLDGELLYGDPSAPDCYRRTVSIVMSEDKPAEGITYYIFDRKRACISQSLTPGFRVRIADLGFLIPQCVGPWTEIGVNRPPNQTAPVPVKLLKHRTMRNEADLLVFESATVQAGHEGVMIRSLDGPYKEGRSTTREGYLLKLKRFHDSEAEVLGVTELMHNANEAKTNALGRTERSSHKAGLVGTGTMGALQVRDVKSGVEFEIGTGFTANDRAALWTFPPIGKLAKYKYFALGSKDKPRFPTFLGWRDKRDV